MSTKVYEYVLRRHNTTLESLSVCEASIPDTFDHIPSLVLNTFECRSIQNVKALEHIMTFLASNSISLHTLKMGRERQLVTKYLARYVRDSNVTIRDAPEEDDASFAITVRQPLALHLQCLELYGMSFPSPTGGLAQWIEITFLRRLCLESCNGVEKVLTYLANCAHRPVQLQEFVLRIDQPTQLLNKALCSFLSSFYGLRLLSVLLDSTDTMPRVDCFLETHGPTIEVLVWEGRKCPRQDGSQDTSHTLGSVHDTDSEISKIFSQCPNLVELSVAWAWDGGICNVYGRPLFSVPFITDLQQWNHPLRTGFLNLPKLRTLHIRNSPIHDYVAENPRLNISEIVHFTHARAYDLLVHGLALDYSYAGVGTASPILQVLIVGPLTYAQHWEVAFMDWDQQHRYHGPRFANWRRPIVFSIEQLRSRFGRKILALDQWRFENVRDLANFFSVECPDSVWLN